jgi:2-polyprenyl-3-methyl-5-hydroxy-6-metoxy-1,4-benzoquinol methylase
MDLEHVDCDLCGGRRYRVRYRKPDNWLRLDPFEYPVVECDDCGLVFVNPRPTMQAMAAFYPPGYHEGRDAESFLPRYRAQHALLPPLAGKRVLDVGCARGDFLAYLLDQEGGFEAHGIDAFSVGVNDARVAFTRGAFEDTTYATGGFDLVMSWAVFEHLHRPSAYFAEAARVLAPGGRLVILVTNADSLYGTGAHLEDVPRHTYHYTERTLAAYARRSGLRLAGVRFDDAIFDGRGRGTFRRLVGRAVGVTWQRQMRNEVNGLQKAVMKLGGALDGLVFATHWEARLRRSGIMVATYEKP